jgi:hypothetical protein
MGKEPGADELFGGAGEGDILQDDVGSALSAVHGHNTGITGAFTPELLRQMQQDPDIATPESLEDEEEFIPLSKPGQSYFTVHPSEEYSLRWAFAFDPLRSDRESDPYIVLPSAMPYFLPEDVKQRWLMLCLRFEDEVLKPFLWAPSWYEIGAEPVDRRDRTKRAGRRVEASAFHKSIDRVVMHARQGWGRLSFDKAAMVYRWRPWPESLGEQPGRLWPLRNFADILNQTFADRMVVDGSHPLVAAMAAKGVE